MPFADLKNILSGQPSSVTTRLNDFAQLMQSHHRYSIGYPVNQNLALTDFYHWYLQSGLTEIALNNAGDPCKASTTGLNSHDFENAVIEQMAAWYGFEPYTSWGVISHSGSESNKLGLYFGANLLRQQTGQEPIVYASAEAHYSIHQLADLLRLELRIIACDDKGQMLMASLSSQLDPQHPALMVITLGTTFKGAIDDQQAINQILDTVKPSAVYRHLDAALFGGYLPFSTCAEIINPKQTHFDSIAVSGHKVFGLDEPAGIFITHRDTFSQQTPLPVAYLQDTVALLGCSRSALSPLKLWWKLQYYDVSDFQQQTEQMLNNAEWLKQALDAIHYPAWRNPCSIIVYFQRPAPWIMEKWQLAPEQDLRLGGALAHCVVMQHVSTALLEQFIDDLKSNLKSS